MFVPFIFFVCLSFPRGFKEAHVNTHLPLRHLVDAFFLNSKATSISLLQGVISLEQLWVKVLYQEPSGGRIPTMTFSGGQHFSGATGSPVVLTHHFLIPGATTRTPAAITKNISIVRSVYSGEIVLEALDFLS